MVRHYLKASDLTKEEFEFLIKLSIRLKNDRTLATNALKEKTLLMLFEKPSLRTRVSFETGMTQLGGHGIFYSIEHSPLGKKELISDAAKVLSRMVDIVMARVNSRHDVEELAAHSTIPIINALDDYAHPCQMLADMMTIYECKGTFQGLKMAYCGDLHNNVTYDLMRSVALLGFELRVAGPQGDGFSIEQSVLDEVADLCKVSGATVSVVKTAEEAAKDCDVIYTDSWMSYGICDEAMEERKKKFMPFQVTLELMKLAKPDCIFMNCLPTIRGMEETAEVIDGPQSVVFQEAENRLHTEKALMLFLLGWKEPINTHRRILVALGGNALLKPKQTGTWEEVLGNAKVTAKSLVELIEGGNELVITHGNGPQVGAIKLQNQNSAATIPEQSLFNCVAMSQGSLGYLLEHTIYNLLQEKSISKQISTIVTMVEVDSNDPSFQNPTKPIGKFYSKEEAMDLRKQGKVVVEDAGRGYRVVVPSPKPQKIIQGDVIKHLIQSGYIVISTGGGGIPVKRTPTGGIEGVDAVIDKDFAGEKLAEIIDADAFLILTDVDHVCLNYNTPQQTDVKIMTVKEAENYHLEGQFSKGSMGPKVQAGINFTKASGKPTIITSLALAEAAIKGEIGTTIIP